MVLMVSLLVGLLLLPGSVAAGSRDGSATPYPANGFGFVSPDRISYRGVPGFDGPGEILEWSRVAQDPVRASLAPISGLRLRWLGTAGFEISDDSTTILVDPFVSRPPLTRTPFALLEVRIDPRPVHYYILDRIALARLDAILVAHDHHDHVMDVPYILAKYARAANRPVVVGSPNIRPLLQAYDSNEFSRFALAGEPLAKTPTRIVSFPKKGLEFPADRASVGQLVGQFGSFRVTAFISGHTSYGLRIPVALDGDIKGPAPFSALGYRAYRNSSIIYLVEYREKLKILVAETPLFTNPARSFREIGKVDILLQGIASREKNDRVASTLAGVRPDIVIPTHYENFFVPLDEYRELDPNIGLLPAIDIFSRLEEFLNRFPAFSAPSERFEGDETYVGRANAMIRRQRRPDDDSAPYEPRLRLLKMFYNYSLETLVRRP